MPYAVVIRHKGEAFCGHGQGTPDLPVAQDLYGVRYLMPIYKVPLVLTRQPEGGYTVTSPLLPELVTEGDTIDEALLHVHDAVQAVVELYEDLGKPLPATLRQSPDADAIQFDYAVAVP